jgi:hypothetical protein
MRYNANKLPSSLLDNIAQGSEIRLFRKGENETEEKLVWAGEIDIIDKEVDARGQKSYVLTIKHWGEVFFKNRYVTNTVGVATDESTIAWDDVVDHIQTTVPSGFTAAQVDWGITQGTLETTGNNRTRTYVQDEALKILQQLADVPDIGGNPQRLRGFRLLPDLLEDDYNTFTYEAEYGITRNVTYISSTIKNIKTITKLSQYANLVTALGAAGIQQQATSTDTSAKDFYKLREKLISRTNIPDTATLLENAEDELATREQIPVTYKIALVENDPNVGKYRTGDLISIKYVDEDGFMNIDQTFRVYKIDINIDDKGIEQATIDIADNKPVNLQTDTADALAGFIDNADIRFINLEK